MAVQQAGVAVSQALTRSGKRSQQGWADVLAGVPLFAGVPKRQLRKIAGLTREARFAAGTTIMSTGDPGNDFFVVLDGNAAILRPHGFRTITVGPGSYFGEMSLIDGGERTATVVAESEVLCLRLSRAPFLRMLRSEPSVAVALLEEFASRIRELQARTQLSL